MSEFNFSIQLYLNNTAVARNLKQSINIPCTLFAHNTFEITTHTDHIRYRYFSEVPSPIVKPAVFIISLLATLQFRNCRKSNVLLWHYSVLYRLEQARKLTKELMLLRCHRMLTYIHKIYVEVTCSCIVYASFCRRKKWGTFTVKYAPSIIRKCKSYSD